MTVKVDLDSDMAAALAKLAKRQGMTDEALLNEIVDNYLRSRQRTIKAAVKELAPRRRS